MIQRYPVAPRREYELKWRKEASAPKKRGRIRGLLVLFFLAGLGMFLFSVVRPEGRVCRFIRGTALFKTREVIVLGSAAYSREELLRMSGAPLAAQDGSVWKLNAKDIETGLSVNPRFISVHALRVLPRMMFILIRERRPAALLSAGKVMGVDRNGVVFALSRKERGVVLPLISGCIPGEGQGLNKTIMAKFWQILTAAGDLVSCISEVNMADPKNAVIFTDHGVSVMLGNGEYEAKFRNLRAVLSKIQKQPGPVKGIDLRWKDQVVVKTG